MNDPEFDIRLSRRKAPTCLGAWSGAAVLWSVVGGVPRAYGKAADKDVARISGFTFAQISDTHLGFHKDANPDVGGTLRRCIADLNALPHRAPRSSRIPATSRIYRSLRSSISPSRCSVTSGRIASTTSPANTMRSTTASPATCSATASRVRARHWYSFDDHGVHFVGPFERGRFRSGPHAHARRRATGLAQTGSRRAFREHAHRRAGAHTSVDGVRKVGLGHGGLAARPGCSSPLRFGHRAQWTHPPGNAEGRGPRRVSTAMSTAYPSTRARRRGIARPAHRAGRRARVGTWARARCTWCAANRCWRR